PVRARACEAAGGARRNTPLADRHRRAGGEDPHVQLPGEPRHRPPDQAHGAPARSRPRRRPRRLHRGPRRGGPPPRARVRLADALAATEDRLAAAGADPPHVDAEWLVAHVLGVSRSEIRRHDEIDAGALEPLLARRERREPLAYVLGEWGFRR